MVVMIAQILPPRRNLGNADAQMALAAVYYGGMGVSQDITISAKWFRKAAEQGNMEAVLILGTLYMSGQGVPKDIYEGVRWIREAAESGDAKAQGMLGSIISTGRIPSKDHLVEAYMWLSLAVAQGERTLSLELKREWLNFFLHSKRI